MSMAKVWAIIMAIFTILAAIAAIAWFTSDAYQNMIREPSPENIKNAFIASPPVQEGLTIAGACNDGLNLNCTAKIATKALEKKAEDASTN